MARRRRASPLPARDGVDATRIVVRAQAQSLLHALLASVDLDREALLQRFADGAIVDGNGRVCHPADDVGINAPVFLYRDLPAEYPVPFDVPVLHADNDIIVVDKPHFLATMPRGSHVVQTALVRLRREFGEDAISPAHRLDRLTAGVLLFTRRAQVRAAYQELFARRQVDKEYRAYAPAPTDLALPTDVANRIEKTAGDLRARVVDGPVNARSLIECVSDDGVIGTYRLRPQTGRTHQLRLHMAGLGVPICNDPLYPEVRPELAALPDGGDFSRPLRLIAARLAFTDPLSGRMREFRSDR